MSDIRKFNDQEDILAWGALTMAISQAAEDVQVFMSEDGYYTDYIHVKMMGRWLKVSVSVDNEDLKRVDPRVDLMDLLKELGGTDD